MSDQEMAELNLWGVGVINILEVVGDEDLIPECPRVGWLAPAFQPLLARLFLSCLSDKSEVGGFPPTLFDHFIPGILRP